MSLAPDDHVIKPEGLISAADTKKLEGAELLRMSLKNSCLITFISPSLSLGLLYLPLHTQYMHAMRRIFLPGLRALIPRASVLSRPLLPITRLAFATSSTPRARWRPQLRMFSYTPLRTNSPSSPSSPPPLDDHAPGPNATLSQRLKHLIKSYGWYALGVYLVFSTLDFTIAFVGINILGAEQVSRVTTAVKHQISAILHSTPTEPGREDFDRPSDAPTASGGRESLYAMIVLAYTVHKTLFLPLRVGLTAALTPRLVNWLRARGWAGGAGTMRAAREMRERVRRGSSGGHD